MIQLKIINSPTYERLEKEVNAYLMLLTENQVEFVSNLTIPGTYSPAIGIWIKVRE